jgi:hypothetical protein
VVERQEDEEERVMKIQLANIRQIAYRTQAISELKEIIDKRINE